jgi:hypothetical protein
VLHGLDFADLDGGNDPGSDIRTHLHGYQHLVRESEDPAQDQVFLVETLRHVVVEQQILGSTGAMVRTNKSLERLNDTSSQKNSSYE